jgi:hypothetical protein
LRLAAQHDTYYHTMPAEGSPLVPVLFQADQYQAALEVLASFIRTMAAESVEGRRRERRKPRTAADHRNAPSVPWWKVRCIYQFNTITSTNMDCSVILSLVKPF